MYRTVLVNAIKEIWKSNRVVDVRVHESRINQKKLYAAVEHLKEAAQKYDQPVVFVILVYAYFYGDVFREKFFESIAIKVPQFLDKVNLERLPKFSGDDIELAHEIQKVWNHMNRMQANDLPFRARSSMSKRKVRLGSTMTFKHNLNFMYPCEIANFVSRHRSEFPQMHGFEEYFVHLPVILRQSREYRIYEYLHPVWSLDKYYAEVYGKSDRKTRLSNLLQTLSSDTKPIEEMYEELRTWKKSSVWCASEVVKHLKTAIKERESTHQ